MHRRALDIAALVAAVIVGAVASLPSGCASPPRASSSALPRTDTTASAPPVATTILPSANATAAAPDAERVDLDAIPPRMRVLFVESAPTPFVLRDDVDPHDGTGSRDVEEHTTTCKTLAPFHFEGAVRGAVLCEGEGTEEHLRYAVKKRGLFLATDGWFPTVPPEERAYSVTFDAGDNEENIPCTRTGKEEGDAYCVTTRCKVPVGYGDTQERLCIDRHGLLLFETENVEGPRRRTLQRLPRSPRAR